MASLVFVTACVGQVTAPAADGERKEQHALMKERAAELSLFRASDDKQPLTRSAEPVRAAKKLTASERKMTIQIVAP